MNVAIILSGGTGSRIGAGIPKQYIKVKDKYMIAYCLETVFACDSIDRVIIVADDMWHCVIKGCIPAAYFGKFISFATPGSCRQLSIFNALSDMECFASGSDRVIIHDAARPFVTDEMLRSLINELDSADGSIPMLPVKDTVYNVKDGHIVSLLDRDTVMAGQAPEAFVYGKYLEANKALLPDRIKQINGSAEAAFLAGMNVKCIPGDEKNVKITTMEDLQRWQNESL